MRWLLTDLSASLEKRPLGSGKGFGKTPPEGFWHGESFPQGCGTAGLQGDLWLEII